MLLYLCLLTGCVCHSFAGQEPVSVLVLQGSTATLPCPHKTGNVTWSRFRGGSSVTLVTIRNDQEVKTDQRYGSTADKSLVIINVKDIDEGMYFCNTMQVYLKVTTARTMVDPPAQPEDNQPVTPINRGHTPADTENQQALDWWKVPVGVVTGATVVLLVILTLRLCSKHRVERKSSAAEPITDVIYQEIEDVDLQPGREPDGESLYYWSSIIETPNTGTPPSTNLYSTVNKPTTEGHSKQECVYSLVQSPAGTSQ